MSKESKAVGPNPITVSVTKFCWSVSKILNFVKQEKKSVLVTNRGRPIAIIKPAADAEHQRDEAVIFTCEDSADSTPDEEKGVFNV